MYIAVIALSYYLLCSHLNRQTKDNNLWLYLFRNYVQNFVRHCPYNNISIPLRFDATMNQDNSLCIFPHYKQELLLIISCFLSFIAPS